jgi:hypothetical protein
MASSDVDFFKKVASIYVALMPNLRVKELYTSKPVNGFLKYQDVQWIC